MDQKLFTFVRLCETLNYRAAAERLHITQPAVTQHIQALEREYACKLIRYNGHTISVTEEGQILLQYIRAAFSREEALKQKLKHTPQCALSIGATKSIGSYVLSDMLKPFLSHPGHTAHITVENTDLLLHLLNQNELDFAIVEGFFDKQAYDWLLLRREAFIGICAPEHPFAGRSVPISALFGNTLLLREVGSGTRAILEQVLLAYNHLTTQFQRTICINDFSLILQLVAANVGISFVYEAVAKHDANVSVFTLLDCPVLREFNYVYLKDTDIAEKLALFQGPLCMRSSSCASSVEKSSLGSGRA